MINEFVFPKKDGDKYMGVKTKKKTATAKKDSQEDITVDPINVPSKSGDGSKLSYIKEKDEKIKKEIVNKPSNTTVPLT
jgi:hypothetical protein